MQKTTQIQAFSIGTFFPAVQYIQEKGEKEKKMTTLVATINRIRTVETEKVIWSVVTLALSVAALNVVPILTGGCALIAARKSGSKELNILALICLITGVYFGIVTIL